MRTHALLFAASAAAFAPARPQRALTTLKAAEPPTATDPQKAARRQALLEASQRAAARIEAIRAGEAPADAAPAPPAPPPPPAQAMRPPAPPPGGPRAEEFEDLPRGPAPQEGKKDRGTSIRERFERAPEGYTPFYNTGEGYLDDLTADSTDRHWSVRGGAASFG